MDKLAEDVISFWEGAGTSAWYIQDDKFDEEIRSRFFEAWCDARDGKFKDWKLCARTSLALILLVDQFPRNMFRGHSDSFATDGRALCIAKKSIYRNFDKEIEGPLRQFFYMPFLHSESLMDQDAGVRAFVTRMPAEQNLLHARAHRQVIREFGRFPYRNDVLGRESTEHEVEYLAAGGYGYTVKNIDK